MADIKPERGDGSLGDATFTYSLLGLFVSLRVRFERVEVLCSDLSQINRAQLSDVAIGTLEAIQSRPTAPKFGTYTLAFGVHGSPVGMSRKEFVSRFSKDGPAFKGGSLGSGTVFYYGAEAEQVAASVTIDLSGILPEGVYLRFNVVWDASKVGVRDLPALGEKFLRDAIESMGLTIEGAYAP